MIQLDIWGGDLHQNLISSHQTKTWAEAFPLIEEAVETGALVNVLHTDFSIPDDRKDEEMEQVLATANDQLHRKDEE